MTIQVPLYPVFLFYIAVHFALALVTGHIASRLRTVAYVSYLRGYFLWCSGYGLGYLLFFAQNSTLVAISYGIFLVAFLGAASHLLFIAVSLSGRTLQRRQKILYVGFLSALFVSLVALEYAIALNLLTTAIGLLATVWLWKKGGSYRLVGPLMFAIIATSLMYAVHNTPEMLQIQLLLTMLFRIFLCIVLLSIAQAHAEREKQLLQEQLIHSEKMDALGQLAGGVSHDFNNMLTGILGAAELLQEEVNSADSQEYLSLIITAAQHAGELTRKLLTFSRKSAKVSSAINVEGILHETVAILQRTIDKAISITIDNQAAETTVIGDDGMLQNALLNMGINASHAMPNGGTLSFILSNEQLSAPYCTASPFELTPGQYLQLSIRDSGCGMSKEVQQHIFEPFFTTKENGKGTGLGLSAVYGMVQEHNGAITVYSEEGMGTVFHLYLPLAETPKLIHNQTQPKVVHGSGTILVIDDEELIRKTVKIQLEALGYHVLLAEDGSIGLALFKAHRTSIDYIILDMIMPVMNGQATLTAIREIDTTVPVLISSGFSKNPDFEGAHQLHISGVLHKPFRTSELSQALYELHRGPHGENTAT